MYLKTEKSYLNKEPKFDSIPKQIAFIFSRNSSKAAIHSISEGTILYGELLLKIKKRALEIKNNNPKGNSVVASITENTISALIEILAIIYADKIALPLNKNLTPLEKSKILNHAQCGMLIENKKIVLRDIDCFSEHTSKNDKIALLIYTSGTTSDPKGVPLTHKNIFDNSFKIINYFKFEENHVKACFLPIYHLFGLISDTLTMLFIGGTVVLCPQFSIGTAHIIHKSIYEYKVNSFSLVPLILEYLNKLGLSFVDSNLSLIISGSAPLSEKNYHSFTTSNPNVNLVPGYGLSETTCYSAINPINSVVPNSIGKAFEFNQIKIIDDNEKFRSHNEIGEVVIKGLNVFENGYYNSDYNCFMESDKSYFRTGDMGYYDKDGYFFITGRIKNMVIRGGDKLYLESVDILLKDLSVDSIDAIAVKQVNDIEEELIIVYAYKKSIRNIEFEKQVRSIIMEKLGEKYLPNKIINIKEIPRTDTKKPKYKIIKKLLDNYDY